MLVRGSGQISSHKIWISIFVYLSYKLTADVIFFSGRNIHFTKQHIMEQDFMIPGKKTELTLKTITEIEELAEDILTDRAQIIDCDKKRNSNREALQELKKTKDNKHWFCIGNLFLKVPISNTVKMLQKDQETLDNEVKKIHNGLKPKVKKLHELEGLPDVKGFDLTSVN
ncbi:p53 and DNA damage-regulated protein 1-like [Hydractinia symbiolongicarpus]|uniref:p53 and DNA damage-regulated protein 1-like n=1 Tax=Hydractinia symbiolongicarpus TaxID=13093 RepID=UPI00254D8191|nr:p53 and DNA damage-regulated protein 1-like [Hydractinia symbiolongicarpus]